MISMISLSQKSGQMQRVCVFENKHKIQLPTGKFKDSLISQIVLDCISSFFWHEETLLVANDL